MERNLSDVSFSLAKHVISAKAKNTNFVFSPLSIHVVLGLIASGSDGPNRDTLLGFLKSKSTEELNNTLVNLILSVFANGEPLGGPRLSIANGVWFDKSLTLKPSFKEIVENVYKAASNHVDFQNKADEVRKEVNRWAEKETNGLIKEVLGPDSVNSMTRRIFANSVYFKANWDEEFDPAVTEDNTFFLLNGSSIRVPFMSMRFGRSEYVGVYEGFKVLRLPYAKGKDKGRKFSMCFFLPDARDGLSALVERIGSESGFMDRHVPRERVRIDSVDIPKFKIEFGFEASEVLRDQGVVVGGGLTEMVDYVKDGEDISVSQIMHKSFIEVGEIGTEAAAFTDDAQMSCGLFDGDEVYVNFVADHPFMFVIREDKSGAVLFIGQLLDPLAT